MAPVKQLKRYFYDTTKPGAYGGVAGLRRSTKLPIKDIQKWLQHQDTYTLHKPVRHNFPRRPIITSGIGVQYQADLIDMRALKRHNNGMSYIVSCIDVFSKYAWCVAIEKKTGAALVEAVTRIFRKTTPINFQTDKGSEFVNKTFLKFLKDRGVHFFTTENEDVKAAIVERFNRTLKEKMWRYFTKTNALRYINVLPRLVRNYNGSFHRSIKMAPEQVNVGNQGTVWNNLYGGKPDLATKQVFSVGDRVRMTQGKQQFKKGYLGGWTEEMFTISRVNSSKPMTYVLKDDNGEELKGSFYTQELQKVGAKQVYRIESVVQERFGARGRVEYLVKWFGYNSSFNSWILAEDMTKYSN